MAPSELSRSLFLIDLIRNVLNCLPSCFGCAVSLGSPNTPCPNAFVQEERYRISMENFDTLL